jgi:Flp pilus assembly protein TadG
MTRATNIYRSFLASRRGVVAIEFAAVLPMLLLLFLGSFDAGNALAIYMKVRSATYALDSIANQFSTIHDTDVQGILAVPSYVIAPYSSTPISVVLSQVKISSAGHTTATVCSSPANACWSAALNGTPLSSGASVTLPPGLATGSPNTCQQYPCYLLLGTVKYTYTPMFGYFLTGPITLSESLFVTPRIVNKITRISP